MPLSPHGRRAELEQVVRESNVRRVIDLVDRYGLSSADRNSLAHELQRHAVATRDKRLEGGLDEVDWASVVADVWREGLWASWPRQ